MQYNLTNALNSIFLGTNQPIKLNEKHYLTK